LLRYLREIRFQVLTAIYPRFTHESRKIRKKQAIDVSKLKRLLCHESQHQSLSIEKSLVQFDYEKAVSNYLGTQSTFKGQLSWGQLGFTGGVKGLTAESLLPPVALLGCGFSLTVCGFGEDFHVLIDYR